MEKHHFSDLRQKYLQKLNIRDHTPKRFPRTNEQINRMAKRINYHRSEVSEKDLYYCIVGIQYSTNKGNGS